MDWSDFKSVLEEIAETPKPKDKPIVSSSESSAEEETDDGEESEEERETFEPSLDFKRTFRYIEGEEGCRTNEYQEGIIKEAMNKEEGGGISAPMGCGKTYMALEMIRRYKRQKGGASLIIASKTLIPNWVDEIEKFYGDTFKYNIIHTDSIKLKDVKWNKDVDAYIITPSMLSKAFKMNGLLGRVAHLESDERNFTQTMVYRFPKVPLLATHNNLSQFIYSTNWTSVFIDEAQSYTNISTLECRAIVGLTRIILWCLSGTLITEPKPQRFLGYFMILHDPFFPNNLPMAKQFLKEGFGGYGRTLVERKDNPIYTGPEVVQEVVEHSITDDEGHIYLMLKNVLDSLRERAEETPDQEEQRILKRFRGWQAISYLRQSIVCPAIPVADIHFRTVTSIEHFGTDRIINDIIREEFAKINIGEWMQDPANIESSRIKEIKERMKRHPEAKQIIFTTFRMTADIVLHCIGDEIKTFTLHSNDQMKKRKDVIEEYKNYEGGAVLVVTYKIGAEGLNLQEATVVHLIDFWWNSDEASQAIKRMDRMGQKASKIFAYLYTSNLGIENMIFGKHLDKKNMIKELKEGSVKSAVRKMSTEEVIVLIDRNENVDLMKKIVWNRSK